MKTTRHPNQQRPIALAALLAAALLAPALLQAQPDNATLRKAVARDLSTQSGGYYEMSNLSLESANIAPVDKSSDKPADTSIHYTASVTGTLTQPFYYSVPTYEYIESIMQVNPAPAREAAQALQGPDAEKLRALAGKDATTANLSTLHLIHETVPAGTPREFAATVTAVAQGKEWLINSTFRPKTPPPQGAPITSYGNNALSIDDVTSVVTIHEKVADALAASNRILALQKTNGLHLNSHSPQHNNSNASRAKYSRHTTHTDNRGDQQHRRTGSRGRNQNNRRRNDDASRCRRNPASTHAPRRHNNNDNLRNPCEHLHRARANKRIHIRTRFDNHNCL